MTNAEPRRSASPRLLSRNGLRSYLKSGATLGLLTGIALSSAGCLDHPVKGVKIKSQQESNVRVSLEVNKDVDILFVIDDSASMGEEQAALAANFKFFVDVLEDPLVDANFRIGVTTTNMGGHTVDGCRTGEQGILQLKSCTERKRDFNAPRDAFSRYNTACANSCKLSAKELEIKPTRVKKGGDEVARAWIEKLDGETNLPKGTSAAEAFQCFGPQGISGCGYEQQLESMYSALRWAKGAEFDKNGRRNPNHGFIRDRAILAIVNVTDEIDCSINTSHPLYEKGKRDEFLAAVFGKQDKATPFWVEGMDTPSSAVCLMAGVNCSGASNGEYEKCEAVNYDIERDDLGSGDDADKNSVLRPVSQYIEYVDAIEAQKKEINSNQEVIVALIGGVNENGSVTYRVGSDGSPDERDNFKHFGIGFGCAEPSGFLKEEDPGSPGEFVDAGTKLGFAIPPVRMAEFTTHFAQRDEQVMFKICSDNFSDPLKNIAKQIRDQIRPACYTECVKDSDTKTPQLDPKCDVLETRTGGSGGTNEGTAVVECKKDKKGHYVFEDGQYALPKGKEVCYVLLADPTEHATNLDELGTKDANDDMDRDCVRTGQNLQFKVQRKKGARPPAGTSIKAVCELSSNRDIDCPEVQLKEE